ncbi:preprotein translocase subunit SecA [bacterium]|nr:preprotein translocase subunit SecA [bacterium]MBT4251069.1 preprotein translocase subunit SecA [bacterium]MBT4597911.1 preprotein translocase subunit SecA [bacterium]MBT6753897.1 preprotein translocase subunit SecA [bacterium]MBT7037327.1 preprotein translocase subunit SecA [bacterium]
MMKLLDKLFGNAGQKELKRIGIIVERINGLDREVKKLSDEELRAKTEEFRELLKNKKKTLDDILPETFAVVREAAYRVIGERPYDSQLSGGIVLHEGKIAEMKTGEGKTLTATLPVYLNALSGKGAHIITVNDYLSKRDANWMGSVYHFLGLSTACLNNQTSYLYTPNKIDGDEVSIEEENLIEVSRAEAYKADVLFGTNNEFGFDYLRDNMAQNRTQMVQRDLNFAIVDEVDSILIDEARTPLIISTPDVESTQMYSQFAMLVPRLKENEDYNIDEKLKSAMLTSEGIEKMEKWLGIGNIYETNKVSYVHHLEQALKANVLFELDKDYVIEGGEIVIVDEFTGRLMPGRRYSEGLHQAIEAKENVEVQRESRTLATITFQNYFRMYAKLAGMTGTALTSAEEFHKVYKLEVIEIPTNQPLARTDRKDVIYKTEEGKFNALIEEVIRSHKKGIPVLVGTIAIEKSEYLAALLKKRGIEREVLNAKNHEREAQIIANAGQKGAVTIATNMAGRGTDIKLGEGVKEVGGLFIIGTERHEARRIDNQLRGRAGRQGDPGITQFFVSLEDELLRRFGGDRMKNIMDKLGLPEDQPIENKIISKSIESAQGKIEGFNFDIRKRVLEYDDVMNKQRETIYKKRKDILDKKSVKDGILQMFYDETDAIVAVHTDSEDENSWNMEEVAEELSVIVDGEVTQLHKKLLSVKSSKDFVHSADKRSAIIEVLTDYLKRRYAEKETEIGIEQMRVIEKSLCLRTIDSFWMDHLEQMDFIREGIGLQGYGQRDPLVMYKKEAFSMFQTLLTTINHTIIKAILRMHAVSKESVMTMDEQERQMAYNDTKEANQSLVKNLEQKKEDKAPATPIINKKNVNRNDPCPCGSGKKFKKCCGK